MFPDLRQPLQDVQAALEGSTPVIDSLVPISQFPILVPVVQVLVESSSDSTAIRHQSTVKKDEILSVFDEEEPPKSDIMFNQSILASVPFALSESIVHEEKEIASPLEEYQDSNHARKDLLVHKNDFDGKLPTFVQLLDGELNDAAAPTFFFPHNHPTHSLDSEEGEEQAFVLEFTNDLKPQLLTEEESITEPVNVDRVEEESTSGLKEQAVELVNKHPTLLFQPSEASTSDVKEEEVSDPDVRSSSVTEKENERELVVEKEQNLESNIETSQNMMEQSLSSTPDQRFVFI